VTVVKYSLTIDTVKQNTFIHNNLYATAQIESMQDKLIIWC
jgi:hypothetical protein